MYSFRNRYSHSKIIFRPSDLFIPPSKTFADDYHSRNVFSTIRHCDEVFTHGKFEEYMWEFIFEIELKMKYK